MAGQLLQQLVWRQQLLQNISQAAGWSALNSSPHSGFIIFLHMKLRVFNSATWQFLKGISAAPGNARGISGSNPSILSNIAYISTKPWAPKNVLLVFILYCCYKEAYFGIFSTQGNLFQQQLVVVVVVSRQQFQ